MKKRAPINKAAQDFLAVKEIRDGVITLKNGSLRIALMVSAINFNLKTAEEQMATINTFRGFLNSLTFPIQIVVQSRVLDLGRYLKKLDEASKIQTSELLQAHTRDFVGFVKNLIQAANIMHKTFYVIIPYDEAAGRRKGRGLFSPKEDRRAKILDRARLISSGLASLGLHNVQLDTQELVEMLYVSYNADLAFRQKLFDVSRLEKPVVQSILEKRTRQQAGSSETKGGFGG